MSFYLVSYDLIKNKNYDELQKKIETADEWCKPLKSLYIIKSDLSANQIINILQNTIDADDRLIVSRLSISKASAWLHMTPEVSIWLKANL